ncbi:hypothetical protein HPB50_010452 [Hyalomma asiaticum]|uniref:Uncharacterized protein n=1 Tax=Hyalomma asiaticum TaxID=266040 RepID=A0ACB7TKH7_HYAAI|nr:hypothetical protein HPB50_010452 [Hyalomma asiaticum]
MWHAGMAASSVPPYRRLTVEVCGHPITMELARHGASVSVMAGKLFKRTFSGVPVEASGVMLCSYSGQLSPVEGQAHASVQLATIHALGARLPEYQEAGLHVVSDVPSFLTDFKSLFQPRVGTFVGSTAGIHVPEEALPRFFKPPPLPLALKDVVTKELQWLHREGILVPVKTSEQAATIVPVPRQDGRVPICGDFKDFQEVYWQRQQQRSEESTHVDL